MISILLLFVISCNSPNETKEKNNCMEITGKDTIWKRHTIKNDAFYQFLPITDSTYKVEWGNRVFNNVSNEVFETSGSGIFQLLDHNEMAIILRSLAVLLAIHIWSYLSTLRQRRRCFYLQ